MCTVYYCILQLNVLEKYTRVLKSVYRLPYVYQEYLTNLGLQNYKKMYLLNIMCIGIKISTISITR